MRSLSVQHPYTSFPFCKPFAKHFQTAFKRYLNAIQNNINLRIICKKQKTNNKDREDTL